MITGIKIFLHKIAHKLRINNLYHDFRWSGDDCTVLLKCCKCGGIENQQFYKNFYKLTLKSSTACLK